MAVGVFPASSELEERIQHYGKRLWEKIQGETPGALDARYWQSRFLEWATQDDQLRTSLFRLIDVLPALDTSAQVADHAREYLGSEARALPWLLLGALHFTRWHPVQPLLATILESQVRGLGHRFIIGANVREALPALRRLHEQGIGFTADLLGEATLGATEAAHYERRYLELIDLSCQETAQWPGRHALDFNHMGAIPSVNVSVKISALEPSLDAVDVAGSVARLCKRLLPIFLRCKERNAFINLDIEQWALHEITYGAIERILEHPDLRTWPHVGIVVQAYLKTARADIERLLALSKRRGAPITVRLVKGAYWDAEVIRARQYGFRCPVFTDKAATDANFERLTIQLLDHFETLHPAFGSHNLRSLSHAIVQAEARGIPPSAYEIQMLFGMAEPEQQALRSQGHRVRLYTPIGTLIPGMAYLVRRLLENTANQGFLRLAYRERLDMNTLLRPPKPGRARAAAPVEAVFRNCPLTDFTNVRAREQFAEAVRDIVGSFPRHIPVVVNGQARHDARRSRCAPTLDRLCPSDVRRCVAKVTLATGADVDRAVAAAARAWPAWRDRPIEERAALLETLADRLESDRVALAALEVFEVGKPWTEADADVAEAIDFCRYYARQALAELAPRTLDAAPGETNRVWYEGRGPAAIIAPWNFPLAILCGMATAALVAGNPVLLKPAEQSSAVGYALHEHMQAAGFPESVVHFLPGDGEEAGGRLVQHPEVSLIAFTGSMEVGLSIIEKAGRTRPGQPDIKKIICEMGGKNAIIIDDDADLDEAVAGVVKSAFGYAGQKCSACSRLLVLDRVYDAFMRRLTDACRSLIIAPAHDPSCELGPVVDAEAHARLMAVISNPGPGMIPIYIGATRNDGYFVPPAIFGVGNPAHPLMQQELFGPILAVMRVDRFDRALEIALSTPFALTGGVYSRNPKHIAAATRRFRVGNLYINRPCTGARVGHQPFGGFGMSGGGTKAGGPGYLLNFAVPRCVTENTTRRGFAPELDL